MIDPALLVLLEEKIGHEIPERRFRQLGETVRALATESGYTSVGEYLALARTLPMDAPLVQSLVHAVTNKESYFFRDAATMQSLREKIFPELIQRCQENKTLRIWSAGCSTGEELYSLSIVLQEMIHDYESWNICLLGTDIDEVAVFKARRGQYKRWSLRTTADPERRRYFHCDADNNNFVLKKEYRKNVAFGLHNLADSTLNAPSPSTFDLIFCRNVLIYFSEDSQRVVHRKFRRALAPGGMWIAGSSDPTPGQEWTTRVHPGVLAHLPETRARRAAVTTSPGIAPAPPTLAHASSGRKHASSPPRPRFGSSSPAPRPTTASRVEYRVPSSPLPPHPSTSYLTSRAATSPSLPAESIVPAGTLTPVEEQIEQASRLADRGELSQALDVLRRVIDVAPLVPTTYLLLAQVQQSLGHPEAAVHELKRAIYLDPSNAGAQLRLGFLLAEQGGTTAAIRAFRAATALVSGVEFPEPEEEEVRRTAAAQLVRLLREENP